MAVGFVWPAVDSARRPEARGHMRKVCRSEGYVFAFEVTHKRRSGYDSVTSIGASACRRRGLANRSMGRTMVSVVVAVAVPAVVLSPCCFVAHLENREYLFHRKLMYHRGGLN